jgi:hypothetical protein
MAIEAEGFVDGLTWRNHGRSAAGDLLEVGGLRRGQFGSHLTGGGHQVPDGLLQGIVEELI